MLPKTRNTFRTFARTIVIVVLSLAPTATASAYVGPGAGFTVLGTGLLTIAIALLVLVGIVWYPFLLAGRTIARYARRLRERRDAPPA